MKISNVKHDVPFISVTSHEMFELATEDEQKILCGLLKRVCVGRENYLDAAHFRDLEGIANAK